MKLREYYKGLTPDGKRKFFVQCIKLCRVGIPTVRAWINKDIGTGSHRNPLPVYRPILAKITGMPEEYLFPPKSPDTEGEGCVLICNSCKNIWTAPKDRCDCGCTTLTETHESNRKFARNYDQNIKSS